MTLPIAWLEDRDPFPPTHLASGADTPAPGLLAVTRQVDADRLEEAYAQGIFPWYTPEHPPLWWSPDPRMVLPVAAFRVSRSLRKSIQAFARSTDGTLRVDSAFEQVIDRCAQVPRHGQSGTWIVPALRSAYLEWHQRGAVHSFETWRGERLIGGLYGVCLGRMFFGESMFALEPNASKIALAALVACCRTHGIDLIDCQQETAHLASLGARPWPRARFEAALHARVHQPALPSNAWAFAPTLWSAVLAAPAQPLTP